MRYNEIIDEYQMVPTPSFVMPDFSTGKYLGKIQSRTPITLEVWKMSDDYNLSYAAIDPKIGPTKPVAYLGFLIMTGVIMAKNALTEPSYQKQGILSELFLFVNKTEQYKILSDVELSSGGEALWLSLIKSGRFSTKILYVPTGELFDLNDINKTTTSDGEPVISPKNDDKLSFIYNLTSKTGQRFFYLLEQRVFENIFEENGDVKRHKAGIAIGHPLYEHCRKDGILQPYSYFEDGSP